MLSNLVEKNNRNLSGMLHIWVILMTKKWKEKFRLNFHLVI